MALGSAPAQPQKGLAAAALEPMSAVQPAQVQLAPQAPVGAPVPVLAPVVEAPASARGLAVSGRERQRQAPEPALAQVQARAASPAETEVSQSASLRPAAIGGRQSSRRWLTEARTTAAF